MGHFNSRNLAQKGGFSHSKKVCTPLTIFCEERFVRKLLLECSLRKIEHANLWFLGASVTFLLFVISGLGDYSVVDSECNSDQVHVIFCARIFKVVGFLG